MARRKSSTQPIDSMFKFASAVHKASKSARKKARREEIRRNNIAARNKMINANIKTVDEYQKYINEIKSCHTADLETIDWQDVYNTSKPFEIGETGPKELQAQFDLDNYKPGLFQKLSSNSMDKKIEKLKNAVIEARQEDQNDYIEWEETHQTAELVLGHDIETCKGIIEETAFQDNDDIPANRFSFDMDIIGTTTYSIITANIDESLVPNYTLKMLKSGNVSKKDMPIGEYNLLKQDLVCSVAIRLANEVFSVLPINNILVNVTSTMNNTKTGLMEDMILLSVDFTRDYFVKSNLKNIDPSDFVSQFVNNMNFKKNSGFIPVDSLYKI